MVQIIKKTNGIFDFQLAFFLLFSVFAFFLIYTATFGQTLGHIFQNIVARLEQQSEIILANFDLFIQTIVRHFELNVIPCDHIALAQIFVHIERPDLVLNGFAQFLATLKVPNQVGHRMVLAKFVIEQIPIFATLYLLSASTQHNYFFLCPLLNIDASHSLFPMGHHIAKLFFNYLDTVGISNLALEPPAFVHQLALGTRVDLVGVLDGHGQIVSHIQQVFVFGRLFARVKTLKKPGGQNASKKGECRGVGSAPERH
ncbi:hypothetical protein BpHYR1_026911 [Brachionus plicatilis]|uniref:Uncharacterized protein n=1 Tax=Brachionus plicatilis TaxID=10195 RepID=A0A3M7RPB9_BRAPC|nr:hypothetical protein BpHYR1_026911 [Brachionus plicatilis]